MSYIKNPPFPKNYADEFLMLDRGRGAWVWDTSGRKYLDFASGIAVSSLGHRNPEILRELRRQSSKLIHVSNLYTTVPAVDLAESLVRTSPKPEDQPWSHSKHPGYFAAVHFGNSGSEANESALKYAKVYSQRKAKPNGRKLLAFKNGFHGRTLGVLAVTHTEKYRKPYEPLMEGVEFADFNDAAAVTRILNSDFTAVIVEPIQGEGGLNVMTREFANALNEACRKHEIVLIADEVQSGMYRSGTLFASEQLGLEPDIITLAKPMAGGLPLSATLIPAKINDLVHVGDHGTTFGGGPLTTAVAGTIWRHLNKPSFQRRLEDVSRHFEAELEATTVLSDKVGEVLGLGMLRGLRLKQPEKLLDLIAKCREKGLIVLRSGTDVLRLAPPLTVGGNELKQGFRIIRAALEEL